MANRPWDQDKLIDAWNFAAFAHRGQFVPGSDVPYLNHLGLVTLEVMAVVVGEEPVDDPDLLIQCAVLHDCIEDTETTFEDVAQRFGRNVAQGTAALSKDPRLADKSDRIKDSLARIRKQPKEVWMVKLADRITNLQPPPSHWDRKKRTKYRDEAVLILETLSEANAHLAKRLKQKISQYAEYIDTP